jgi:hypothetical protein
MTSSRPSPTKNLAESKPKAKVNNRTKSDHFSSQRQKAVKLVNSGSDFELAGGPQDRERNK